MAGRKQKQSNAGEAKTDSLWRSPITLDSFEDEDPLATLYRGREVGGGSTVKTEPRPSKAEKIAKPAQEKSKISAAPKKASPENVETAFAKTATETETEPQIIEPSISPKITESELKSILKIKSESFHFTDLREILRGKSFDIYAYLRLLSGDSGFCKIKHLDLMKKLDISRPTLFKQGEWLTRLNLIEKRNVPGDHLGTSYTVRRLEEVLPISDDLIRQLESQTESFT